MIFTGEEFIAVSVRNTVITSNDGHRWVSHRIAAEPRLVDALDSDRDNYIVWGGQINKIIRSQNDISLETVMRLDRGNINPQDRGPKSTASGNGILVAVGNRTAWVSPDWAGSVWRKIELPMSGFTSVVFGNGIFLAVGCKGSIIFSRDGVSWNECTPVTEKDLTDVSRQWRVRGGGKKRDDPDLLGRDSMGIVVKRI